MDKKIVNNWLKTYFIGPMQKTVANDGGVNWRIDITIDLKKRIDNNGNPIYLFDPTIEEQNKTGYNPADFHNKVIGWLASGNNDKVADGTDLIWRGKDELRINSETGSTELVHLMGDMDYVENSNFLICKIEKGDEPCGTYGEAILAFRKRIPIYVIQTMSRSEYMEAFVGWVFGSGGNFFSNKSQLLEFLDKTYNLKLKED